MAGWLRFYEERVILNQLAQDSTTQKVGAGRLWATPGRGFRLIPYFKVTGNGTAVAFCVSIFVREDFVREDFVRQDS